MKSSKLLLLVLAAGIALLLLASILLSRRREVPAPADSAAVHDARPAVEWMAVDPTQAAEDKARTALETGSPAAPDAQSSAAPEVSFLLGRVLDEDRNPVADATVALVVRPAGDFATLIDSDYLDEERTIESVVTDASGAFRFEVEPVRTYSLRASHVGFCESQLENLGAGPPIDVVLARGADLVVHVVRAVDGAPIAEARVIVMHDARVRNPESRTDVNGRARFDALPPGGAYVQAMPAHETPRGIEVELVAGRENTALFELKEGQVVTGTVRDRATRSPIAGAEVSSWDFYDKTLRTDAQGQYRIEGVDPGGVDFRVVSARAPGYGRVDRRVSLATGTEPICDFELARALTLRGRVVDGSGAPIAGAYVGASGNSRQGGTVTRDYVSGRTRDDGRFELAGVSREMGHALFLRAQGHETRTIDVPAPAADVDAIDVGDLALGPGAGIEGVVVSSTRVPIPSALLVLRHVDASPLATEAALGMQHVYTDAHGRFRVAELAAGRHEIRVHVGGYTDLNTGVELRAGELRRGVELELSAGGALAGVVVDEHAIPVEDAEVHVSTLASARWIGRCRTAKDGSFRIEGLPDEALRIGAQRFEPLEGPRGEVVRLLPSAETEVRPFTTDLRIVLPLAGTIEGRILAADGTGLVGGCVEAFDAEGRSVGQARGRDGNFTLLVPAGATVRLVGFRQTLDETGRFRRVPMPGEQAVVEGVSAGARDVIVRFAKTP